MDAPNYYFLKHFSILNEKYCCFDTEEECMNQITKRYGIKSFKYLDCFYKDELKGSCFIMSIALAGKHDRDRMELALKDLDKRLLLQFGRMYKTTKEEFLDYYEERYEEVMKRRFLAKFAK